MRKMLVVIRREYTQGVRSKTFVISTVLGPIMMIVFTVVPGLLFNLNTGDATRLAVVDQTGKLYERVRDSIMRADDQESAVSGGQMPNPETAGNALTQSTAAPVSPDVRYTLEQVMSDGRPLEDIKRELDERVRNKELDAYVMLPRNILEPTGEAGYYGRNLGDVVSISHLQNRLSRAVISQRLIEASIDQGRVDELSRDIRMSTTRAGGGGREESQSGSFFLALGVGLFIYVAVLMYGQVILSAVVEEKTSRIVEVLFSSIGAFPLMAGKLIGVSLVALTQYALWALLFTAFALYGAGMLAASGVDVALPQIAPSLAVYALLFFLLGFYIYATLYALLGSMVTSEKEGGQLSLPIVFLLMTGTYLAFPVIRSPGSSFSFWMSMIPFFSPITMLVRIVTETPPFWQIALSLLIGVATVILLVWFAARVYRIGMLMYGKRPSIPEVLRWVRQT
ncbi:MAG: ABC transporter permease [Acidobacteriota bacterium]|nr:ABC transporter permease [Acidobacteriota bacterium]